MKAVSPLVATAILLVVTVAGGVIIYNYMMNTLSSPQNYASITVLSAKMLVDSNRTIINVKLTNIGTASATVDKLEIIPDNITQTISVTIDPGTTKSVNVVINKPLDTSQKHYVIAIYGDQETEPVLIELIK